MKHLFLIFSLILVGLAGNIFGQSEFRYEDTRANSNWNVIPGETYMEFELNHVLNKKQFAAKGTANLVDSILVTHSNLLTKKRHIYTYDNNGNMILELIDHHDFNNWNKYAKNSYTYDNNGNRTMFLSELGGKNSMKITYAYYDSTGNRHSKLIQTWDETLLSWRNVSRTTITYDGNGNPTTNFYESWDSINSQWTNSQFGVFVYIGGRLVSAHYDNWRSIGSQEAKWIPSIQYTYANNIYGDIIWYERQQWDIGNGVWYNQSRANYSYNNEGNRVSEAFDTWNRKDNIWESGLRYTHKYDSLGNRTSNFREGWRGSELGWVGSNRERYRYDSIGNLILYFAETWRDTRWTISDGSLCFKDVIGGILCIRGTNNDDVGEYTTSAGARIDLYYKTNATEVVEEENNIPTDFSLSQNYPNPFGKSHAVHNPTTTITYQIPSYVRGETSNGNVKTQNFVSQLVQLKVYDILGNEIAVLVNEEKESGSHKVNFNASQLSSGIYFYRITILTESFGHSDKLQMGDFVETKKMILIK